MSAETMSDDNRPTDNNNNWRSTGNCVCSEMRVRVSPSITEYHDDSEKRSKKDQTIVKFGHFLGYETQGGVVVLFDEKRTKNRDLRRGGRSF